jgi:hypothetical protein
LLLRKFKSWCLQFVNGCIIDPCKRRRRHRAHSSAYYTILINGRVELINKIEFRLISCGGSLTWLDRYRQDHTWGNHHQWCESEQLLSKIRTFHQILAIINLIAPSCLSLCARSSVKTEDYFFIQSRPFQSLQDADKILNGEKETLRVDFHVVSCSPIKTRNFHVKKLSKSKNLNC